MRRRKVQLDVKALVTSVGALVYVVAVGLFNLSYNAWIDKAGFVGVMIVATSAVAVLYGLFGTFLSALSVGSRHSERVKRFWEGGS